MNTNKTKVVKTTNHNNIINFSIEKLIPLGIEKKVNGKPYCNWGEDNKYPTFLELIYDSSPYHRACVDNKVLYIKGNGLIIDETISITPEQKSKVEYFLNNINPQNTANEVLELVTLDLELYGGFSLQPIFNNITNQLIETHYINIASLRKGNTNYYYSNDWSKLQQSFETTEFKELDIFDVNNKTGTSILTYIEPTKGLKHYPKPNYYSCITSIMTDCELQDYNHSTVVNNFNAGTLVSFNNGIPTKEEQEVVEAKMKKKFTGAKNGSSLMISFAEGADTKPTVESLNGNNLADRYNLLDEKTQQKIFVGHKITSPILFGIKTEGSLGNSTELGIAYEIFKKQYANAKQIRLENFFNYLLELQQLPRCLKIEPLQLIDAVEEPIPTTNNNSKIVFETESNNDEKLILKFLEIGKTKDDYHILKNTKNYFANGNDALLNEIGLFSNIKNILFLDDFYKRLLKVIIEKPDLTVSELADILSVTEKKVIESKAYLIENEYITDNNLPTDKGNNSNITDDTSDIQVMYEYVLKDGVTGSDIIDGSRDFCRNLINLNKLYSRSDIDQLSLSAGRDVWRYRGGWWNQGNKATPSCRHSFKQVIVRKKK